MLNACSSRTPTKLESVLSSFDSGRMRSSPKTTRDKKRRKRQRQKAELEKRRMHRRLSSSHCSSEEQANVMRGEFGGGCKSNWQRSRKVLPSVPVGNDKSTDAKRHSKETSVPSDGICSFHVITLFFEQQGTRKKQIDWNYVKRKAFDLRAQITHDLISKSHSCRGTVI